MLRQGLKLSHVYPRLLQQAVKSEDLLTVAREGFGVRNKTLECGILIKSAAVIVSASFASATLSNINIFAIVIQRRYAEYLRWFDADLAAVAEQLDVCESV